MMEQDREGLCGPRLKRDPDRKAGRAGTTPSEAGVGGKRPASKRSVESLARHASCRKVTSSGGLLNGSEAFLNVQGSSSADFVDVQDNDATGGNAITLGPNSVKGSNTPGWLTGVLVPALGALGLAVLGLSLLWSGRRALATRRWEPAAR